MDEPTPATHSDSPELETRDMMLNIGPAHPAMHGIVRILAKLDGEHIEEADVEIGYLHRAFEKMSVRSHPRFQALLKKMNFPE